MQTLRLNGYRYVLERWTLGPSAGWCIHRTTGRPLRGCPGHYSSFSCAGAKRADMLAAAREDAQHNPGGIYA